MFLQYAISKYKSIQDDLAYRIYVTDSFYAQGRGLAPAERFVDKMELVEHYELDGDEIAQSVIKNAGLRVQ